MVDFVRFVEAHTDKLIYVNMSEISHIESAANGCKGTLIFLNGGHLIYTMQPLKETIEMLRYHPRCSIS